MALVAPIPSASVSTATAVKPGARRSWRTAYFASWPTAENQLARAVSRSRFCPCSSHSARMRPRSPSFASAFLRASSSVIPSAKYSRMRISRWNWSSASTSSATEAFQSSDRSCWPMRDMWGLGFGSRREQHLGDGRGPGGPLQGFVLELRAPLARQAVDLRLAAQVAHAPLRLDEAAPLHPVEGRVEGAFFDLQGSGGGVLEPLGDGVPMPGPAAERLQHQRVEGAMEQILAGREHRATSLGHQDCLGLRCQSLDSQGIATTRTGRYASAMSTCLSFSGLSTRNIADTRSPSVSQKVAAKR